MRLDKNAILQKLNIPAILSELMPDTKPAGTGKLLARCPWPEGHTNGDAHPSFLLFTDNGGFRCQGCNKRGSLFDLYAHFHGLDFKGSLYALAERAGVEVPKNKHPRTDGIFAGRFDYGAYWKERIQYPDGSKDFIFYHGNRVKCRGTEPVLYNQECLQEAGTVFFPEGEKQVDLLKSWGLAAVSLDAGAKSRLTAAMVEQLTGKQIIILQDNDEPGAGLTKHITETMWGKASVKVIVLTPDIPKGDVIDWAATPGNDATKLLEIVTSTPEYQPPQPPSDWPEPTPLPDNLSPVLPLDPELIPEALRGWILDIADRMEIPPDFSAAAAMVALGSIIGRGCGIRPKRHDDWLVIPNTFGGVVGRPSLLKTPAIAEAMKPLERLEAEARDAFKLEQSAHEIDKMVARAKRDDIVKQIRKTVADGKTCSAESLKSQLAGLETQEPSRRRFFTSDGTPEKIVDLLNQNPRGILIKRDELIGWLRALDKDGREGARALFLEGWNGTSRYSYDTIRRGTVDVEALTLSVFGAITPGALADYVYTATRGGGGDDGLLQRFQFLVWPDAPSDWRNIDRWPDTEQKNRAFSVFQTLAGDIPGTTIDEGDLVPYLRFTPAAQSVFDEWRMTLELRLRRGEIACSALESHLGKYRSLMPTIALIVHLADVVAGLASPGDVSERAALMAVGWCEYLESHAVRVYGGAQSPGMEAARELSKRIFKGEITDGMKPKDIYRHEWSKLNTSEAVKAGLKILEDYDWLTIEQSETGDKGGRRSEIIRLNPGLKI